MKKKESEISQSETDTFSHVSFIKDIKAKQPIRESHDAKAFLLHHIFYLLACSYF